MHTHTFVTYEEFGRRFFEFAVTEERVAAAFADIADPPTTTAAVEPEIDVDLTQNASLRHVPPDADGTEQGGCAHDRSPQANRASRSSR